MDELGEKGYQKCILDDWAGALTIWDEAIRRFPKEKRFYNNRALCYFLRKEYERALEDARYMTRNFPEYVRGHFREGEILCAMGNYEEAYKCFCRVILLDPSCVEAMNELSEVQILILCKKGFSRYQAGCALKRSKDLEEAENILKAGAIPKESDYYFSDDEDSVTIVTANSNTIDPREDPSNPKRCCSLWIGNVTQKMTDSQLASFFKNASKAMRALQGCDLAGNKKVLLRWPNKDLGL